jgi:enterochelin esterase-like enzyme
MPLRGACCLPDGTNVKFHLVLLYFVDTIKYARMGRIKAQAEYQESQA